MKIAVITGVSSGLGIEFLRAAVTLCPEIDTYWLSVPSRSTSPTPPH